MSIGHTPGTEPYRPDMKKHESEITAAEREEAKRRIEGAGAGGEGVAENEMPVPVLDASANVH
jgi:hypothetical protein